MTIDEAFSAAGLKVIVDNIVKDTSSKAASRGIRVVNALRNAELEVLRGQRSGKVYKKPLRDSYYTSSAPGEPPARRTGALRLHWNGRVEGLQAGDTVQVTAVLESGEKYSAYLEEGTGRMGPRPYKDRVLEKSRPEVLRIMGESYE